MELNSFISKGAPLYVPFWMYDYGTEVDYIGKGAKVRVWAGGDTEYTETYPYCSKYSAAIGYYFLF